VVLLPSAWKRDAIRGKAEKKLTVWGTGGRGRGKEKENQRRWGEKKQDKGKKLFPVKGGNHAAPKRE